MNDSFEPDVPTDSTYDAAKELLQLVGVTSSAEIEEIPLCWGNQVCIRFSVGPSSRSNNILFDLTAGVSGNDPDKFFFCIQIEHCREFPVPSDDDVGIYLFYGSWSISKKNTGKQKQTVS